MVYAYIRVSTDKQTVENQRFEVQKFATEKGIVIDRWVSETASGTKAASDRKLAGKRLGREVGSKNRHYKLSGKESLIKTMLEYHYSKAAICRKLKCNPKTLNDHIKRM